MAASILRRLPRMSRDVLGFTGVSKAMLAVVPAVAFVTGLIEAVVLVLLARLSFTVSQGSGDMTLPLGPLGELQVAVGTALAGTLALAVVALGLTLTTAYLGSSVAEQTLFGARRSILHAFFDASWDLQSREREGHLQEVISTHTFQMANGISAFLTFVAALLSLAAIAVVALATNPVGALMILGATAILSLLLRPVSKLTTGRARQTRGLQTELATTITGIVSVAQEVRTFAVGDAVERDLDEQSKKASVAVGRLLFVNRAVPGLYQSLAIVILIVALAAISAVTDGDVAAIGAVVLLLLRSVAYGRELYGAANQAQASWPYVESARAEQQRFVASADHAGTRAVPDIAALAFENVSYSYGGDIDALTEVTATISRGETIGIIGPSGSGKSTLVQVLLRLRQPSAGRYTVNAVDAADLQLDDWYRRVAVVPQRIRTIEGSVSDNIRFYRPGVSASDVEAAARAAHIHEEISAWPDGYDTAVSGVGGSLSGGQLQRLCLARALVGEPQLLVLDEPTSALDTRSEVLVQQTLTELRREMTIVIIAHRLSTLRMCDRIMVFEGGRLAAFEEPEKLVGSSRYYREALQLARLP